MAAEFKDIDAQLFKCKVEIRQQERDIALMRHPAFDPLENIEVGFARGEMTHKDVFETLVNSSRNDETAIQGEFVESCIARLAVAMSVIERQMALARRADVKKLFTDKASVEKCVLRDFYAVRGLYDQIDKLQRYNNEKSLPAVDEEWLTLNLADATAKYERLQRGKIKKVFYRETKEHLVEGIFAARLDYAGLVAEDIGYTLAKTNNALTDALYLLIAADEGVLDRDATLDKLISNSMDYAERQLEDAKVMVLTLEEFLADIYEMGDGDYGRKAFHVTRYRPATIQGLDQLAP